MNICEISDKENIKKYIDQGQIVALPTDTIYGLATSIENYDKIIEIKQRDTKPLAILCSSIEEMTNIIQIPPKYITTLQSLTPGALTIVSKTVNKKYSINKGYDTTGVRIPNHKSLLKLLKETGPLVVSSANISGENETYTLDEVKNVFKDKVNLYVENDQELSKTASTVINIETLEVYRETDQTSKIIEILKQV